MRAAYRSKILYAALFAIYINGNLRSLDSIMKLGFDLYFEMWKKGEISIRKAV